ncbi:MAG: hypothetical protein KC420_19090, partial [Myxococcales bacterium]|nr:hypothetical protein [Myxococcales bacterium]
MDRTVAIAFTWTILAGLATAIGSAIGVLARRTNTRSLSVGLGFSAGAMIFAAFGDLFPTAESGLVASLGEEPGTLAAGALLVVGML